MKAIDKGAFDPCPRFLLKRVPMGRMVRNEIASPFRGIQNALVLIISPIEYFGPQYMSRTTLPRSLIEHALTSMKGFSPRASTFISRTSISILRVTATGSGRWPSPTTQPGWRRRQGTVQLRSGKRAAASVCRRLRATTATLGQ